VPPDSEKTVPHLDATYGVTYVTIDQIGEKVRDGTLRND
jgi:hypothetical protein